MANKYHTYFGQVITNSELNEIFDALFVEVDRFIQDFGYRGIVTGGTVAQHSPTNLSVDIDGPTIVYDQAANRMAFASLTNVSVALDENGAATPVIGSLNEKWLSLYMQFVTTPSDPRTDDLGNTVYFKDVESYRINVVQGAEAAIGTPTKPALRADQILIADVLLGYGVTAIVNAKISSARSQVAYDLTGTPLAVRAKNFTEVLQTFLDALNSGLTTIAALDVDNMIADALTGSPTSIPSGAMHGILQAMLNATNTARTNADAAQSTATTAQSTATTAQSTANSAQSAVTTLDGLAGKKAVANTWTQPQTYDFNAADDANPVRKVTKSAHDHPSSGSNKWKLIDRLTCSNGLVVRTFSGEGADANWCITYNAKWDPASGGQNWSKDNNSFEANLLRCVDGELHWYGRTGGGTWLDTEWDDQNRGVLYVGDSIAAGSHISAGGDFKYTPARTRSSIIRAVTDTLAPGQGHAYIIDKPPGATLGTLDAKVNCTGDTVATVYAIRKHTYGWGTPSNPATDIVDTGTPSSGTGVLEVHADFGGITVSEDEDYYLSIQATGSTGTCVVLGLQVNWTDPGPANT